MKALLIAGVRPNFMKIAPLIEEMQKYRQIHPVLVHTGQHYNSEMSEVFFRDLKIPKPNYHLGVGGGSSIWQITHIMEKLEPVLDSEKPDVVIVVGDPNSTLAGALTAVKLRIPLVHIEAGCRSFDREKPEELNCLLVDHMADFLFPPSSFEKDYLLREGIDKKKIFLVGNIMTDLLLKYVKKDLPFPSQLSSLQKEPYALLTLHRQETVDKKERLQEVLEALATLSPHIPIVFPIHPRTKKMAEYFGFQKFLTPFIITSPLPYPAMTALVKHAKFVLTDSGGLQHETTVLGIPCLTLKNASEWPITLLEGTNQVVGTQKETIIKKALEVLNNPPATKRKARRPRYWDGKTAKRIVRILLRKAQ